MFNIGGGELIVILLIALIVLGPQRLPDAARQLGKAMGDLRRLSSGFQNEMKQALETADDPTRVAARRNVLGRGGARADDAEADTDAGRAVRRAPPPTTPPRATSVAAGRAAAARRAPGKQTAVGAARSDPARSRGARRRPRRRRPSRRPGAARRPDHGLR